MINAALTNNLKYFAYSSVLHPCLRKLLNHDCKRYVEGSTDRVRLALHHPSTLQFHRPVPDPGDTI